MELSERPGRNNPEAVALAIASGGLYALAQPGWGYWPLAFVCAMPLVEALRQRGVAARAALGWLAGTIATGFATVVPAAVGSSAYFELPLWQAGIIAATVGQVFGAGSFALLAVLAGDPARGGTLTVVRVAAAWTAAEFVRSTVLTGLPWLLFAQALTPVPALIQAASYGGALSTTLLVVAANVSLVQLWRDAGRRKENVLACLAIAALFGSFAVTTPAEVNGGPGSLRVLLVQGDVPNAWRGDPRSVTRSLKRLVELSEATRPLDLLVWPENALSFVLPVNDGAVEDAVEALPERPRFLLLGAPRIAGETRVQVHNAAVLFDENGLRLGAHDKVHLLPFAEYLPAPIAWFGDTGRDVIPGEHPRVLEAGETVIGPLVCYEIAFSELARSLVRDGAAVLVNVSNDGWFGTTGAVEQHFSAAILRAVEFRRPVIRATNTGVTAIVDPSGHVRARAPLGEVAVVEGVVSPRRTLTVYARTGDWLSPACLVLTLLWWLRDRRSIEPGKYTRK